MKSLLFWKKRSKKLLLILEPSSLGLIHLGGVNCAHIGLARGDNRTLGSRFRTVGDGRPGWEAEVEFHVANVGMAPRGGHRITLSLTLEAVIQDGDSFEVSDYIKI